VPFRWVMTAIVVCWRRPKFRSKTRARPVFGAPSAQPGGKYREDRGGEEFNSIVRPGEGRDPYAAAVVIRGKAGKRMRQQQTSVVMGPGLRQDDKEIFPYNGLVGRWPLRFALRRGDVRRPRNRRPPDRRRRRLFSILSSPCSGRLASSLPIPPISSLPIARSDPAFCSKKRLGNSVRMIYGPQSDRRL